MCMISCKIRHHGNIALALSLAMLAACSPSPADTIEKQDEARKVEQREETLATIRSAASPAAGSNCLPEVWALQVDDDKQFDQRNDAVSGGSISCSTGTSPSQYQAVIDDLRDAARKNDTTRLMREMQKPLLLIDAEGKRSNLSRSDIIARTDEIFDTRLMALFASLELTDLTVRKDQGGFFALGAIWLSAEKPGGRPHIATLNLQALEEADTAGTVQAADKPD